MEALCLLLKHSSVANSALSWLAGYILQLDQAELDATAKCAWLSDTLRLPRRQSADCRASEGPSDVMGVNWYFFI